MKHHRHLPLSALAASLLFALGAQAQAQEKVELDLPGTSLDKALNALARQSSVQIIFASDITAGKTTKALKGSYTPRQALTQLLDHSGLTASAGVSNLFNREYYFRGIDTSPWGRQPAPERSLALGLNYRF